MFLAPLLISLFITPSSAQDYEVGLKKICREYPFMRCQSIEKILKPKGRWKTPSESELVKICKKKKVILAAAKEYSVSPLIMTACLVSERSLLLNFRDLFENLIAMQGYHMSKVKFACNPSLGFSQIRMSTAFGHYGRVNGLKGKKWSARNFTCSKKYKKSNYFEIIYEQLNSDTVFKYTASVHRESINSLRKKVPSIARRTELICTNYQTGKLARYRRPFPNAYGAFARLNLRAAKWALESRGCEDPPVFQGK